MTREKRPTTLVSIRGLLLRIAMMVVLVGLAGVLIKKGVFVERTSSLVFTPEETERPDAMNEPRNHRSLAANPNGHSAKIGLPLALRPALVAALLP